MTKKKAKLDHCPECGFVLDDALGYHSPKQFRAFHQMVRIALDNWPESHPEIQPMGATKTERFEHLRAWLLCKAGWRRVLGERLSTKVLATAEEQVAFAKALYRAARHDHCFPAEYMDQIVVVTPKTMKSISHENLQQIFDEVIFIVERETGLKVEFIKQRIREIS